MHGRSKNKILVGNLKEGLIQKPRHRSENIVNMGSVWKCELNWVELAWDVGDLKLTCFSFV
jgi:hypothetical protein